MHSCVYITQVLNIILINSGAYRQTAYRMIISQTVIFTYCKVNNNKNMITSSLRVYAIARLYDYVNMLFQYRYSSKSQL